MQQKQKVDEEKQKKQSTSEEKEPLEGKLPETEYQEYLPDLFRLPIHGVEPNTMVRATVTYVENLDFQKGMFLLQVPMKLSSKIIARGFLVPSPFPLSTFPCVWLFAALMEVFLHSSFPPLLLLLLLRPPNRPHPQLGKPSTMSSPSDAL